MNLYEYEQELREITSQLLTLAESMRNNTTQEGREKALGRKGPDLKVIE